jgi:transcription initiation factor IIE alpha subunit
MIKTLHEMECKLGRLPYAYEVIEHTGQSTKSVIKQLINTGIYPKHLLINPMEKAILDHWPAKTPKQIADKLGMNPCQISQYLITLNDKGVISYKKQTRIFKEKKKKSFELVELKPLPTRRMWQRDPASGMIGGIL